MKKIIGLFFLCVAFLSIQGISYAQSGAPNGINYQAVIRDNMGTLVANSPVAIRINIRQNSASGVVIFSEKHLVTTTQYGLVNFVIGAGAFLNGGPFATINWGNGPYYLDLGVAFSGLPNPTTYMAYGTQQMMSVPFALYAKSSGNLLNQWKYGTGVPAVNLGTTGDYYLDTATGNVYSKTNGTMWILISNIMGPQGPLGLTGAQGIQGITGPSGASGTNGAAGATGPTGLSGAQGIQGLPGTNGTNGAVGATGAAGTNAGVGGFTHYLGEAFNGGIIYYLYKGSDGLEHGLIVALTESNGMNWQSSYSLTGANRAEDGAFNTALMTTNSPVAAYIATLGAGWYLPSIGELILLEKNIYSAQKGLRLASGATLLSMATVYWSSTEDDLGNAYAQNFSNDLEGPTVKGNNWKARGIKAF